MAPCRVPDLSVLGKSFVCAPIPFVCGLVYIMVLYCVLICEVIFKVLWFPSLSTWSRVVSLQVLVVSFTINNIATLLLCCMHTSGWSRTSKKHKWRFESSLCVKVTNDDTLDKHVARNT